MITDVAQRWRERRASYRPAGEVIDPRRYEVAPIATDTEARAFVVAHHYSASYPAARVRIGLYRAGALVGVAVFSVPAQAKALDVLPCDRDEAVELGRLVLLDEVAGNGESWFVAQAFDELRRRGFAGVLSFSDPLERRAADGALVKPGHRGVIYQALSAVYTGRATPRSLWILPDGTVFSERALSKLRTSERGWRYAAAQLVAAGAAPADVGEDLGAWARRELARLGRRQRHHGNHRYLFALTRATRRALPAHLERRGLAPQPYPRVVDGAPPAALAA